MGGSKARRTNDLLKKKAPGLADIPEASLNDRKNSKNRVSGLERRESQKLKNMFLSIIILVLIRITPMVLAAMFIVMEGLPQPY